MRSAILASAATLLAVTQARIAGFYAPQNAAPDTDVKIEIFTEGYIQSVNDVAISFGLTTANTSYLGALGTFVSSKFLGPGIFSSALSARFLERMMWRKQSTD